MKIFWTIGFTFALGLAAAGLAAYGTSHFVLNRAQSPAGAPAAEQARPPLFTAAEIAALAPHKALYKIDMVQKSSASQVLGIAGQMSFDWKPDCGAWTTRHHFDLVYDYADNPQMKLASDFITYEDMSGDHFYFNSRRLRDGDPYEELRGYASMPETATSEGKAVYTMPSDLDFTLPPGTLFPMAQTLAVLRAAHQGKKFLSATVFDGSDQDGPVEVNTFIGPPVQIPAETRKDDPMIDRSLLKSPARLVRLAFFPLNSAAPDSDYEMSLMLYDNGVIGDMQVDYKDFSVTQKLVELHPVKGRACGPHSP